METVSMLADVDGFGYDPTTREPIPVSRPRYVDVLPAAASVQTKFLPPVGQQGTAENPGSPGTCCAWATTYGLATFTAAKAGKVDPSTTAGQASPAFIYIEVVNGDGTSPGTCADTGFNSYFKLLASGGTPSMQTAPYVANCAQLWEEYNGANPAIDPAFQIGAPVKSVDTNDLDSVKQVLASGRALAYGTKLYTDWNDYQGDPVPYYGNGEIKIGKNGKPVGHCMLIIGYDDRLQNGALLIQNSQGTAWGSNGYIWMAYNTFQVLAQGHAYYVAD